MNIRNCHLLKLRKKLADFCEPHQSLEQILIVGAMTNDKNELVEADYDRLQATARLLRENKTPLSQNFTISYMNLAQEYGGEDFLTVPSQADVIISAHILKHPSPIKHKSLLSSPRHTIKGIWATAANNAGAKVITAFGDVGEISEEFLQASGWLGLWGKSPYYPVQAQTFSISGFRFHEKCVLMRHKSFVPS